MRASTSAWLVLTAALGSVAATLFLLHPDHDGVSDGSGVDPVVVVGQIQALSRLETASVELQTTVEGWRGEGWLRAAAGESLVFQGVGEARAGVDLRKLQPEDLWVDDLGVVWVRLPQAEIFDVTLDPERSAVIARERGLFGRANARFEGDARKVAVQRLRAQAGVVGLEAEAADGARDAIRALLEGLGVEEVRFVVDDSAVVSSS